MRVKETEEENRTVFTNFVLILAFRFCITTAKSVNELVL